MSVACGESPAPTAMRAPRRSARPRAGESARTTTIDVRSQSLSRIATARARRPRAAASRSASIHASGEFHATSTWPARCASTWRS
jgi:hypothetical protein